MLKPRLFLTEEQQMNYRHLVFFFLNTTFVCKPVGYPPAVTLTGCLQALAASFPPHFRDNLWNQLLCQSNLRWQPPARVYTHTHKCAGLPAWDPAWWSWILSRISNLDWLGSAQTLPSLQGHLCCEEKKRRWQKRGRSERSPIGEAE